MLYYRGAYWTFDSQKFYDKLLQLKDPEVSEILFPSFDHAVKDPEEDTVSVVKRKDGTAIPTVIVAEGLYLLLKSTKGLEDPWMIPDKERHLKNWKLISDLFNYKVYIEWDLDESMQRVLIRNSAAIGYDLEFWRKRVQEVDRENGIVVMRGKEFADVCVDFQFSQSRA